jgi:hypothetical protein
MLATEKGESWVGGGKAEDISPRQQGGFLRGVAGLCQMTTTSVLGTESRLAVEGKSVIF